VLIYWHVERKSMAIHSQLIGCSASEVAAMIEGVMRHGTTMEVEASYTDSHGQSEIGFGVTRLPGFDLLPRIKRVNKTRLYRPAAGEPGAWQRLEPALTRPIRWDLIAAQYDQMIKYATAIRAGTASTEAILRRFTKANAIHPAYQAIAETGRAQRTIFLARYLRDRDLQREIGEGLNVVESWNRANAVIFFGKGGDIATNRRDEQELSVLCLRILQAALVYVNTLMVQDVLADDAWADRLTAEDKRGLTPLFWDARACLQAPGYHLRGELFDVMAGAQLGDRCVKRACRAGDQLSKLLLVVLVAGGGHQEDHASWAGARVGECVRAAARDIHHAPWPATGHRGPSVRLPALPVARGPDPRFEGEQVELTLQDIEQLFGVTVQVGADVESRPDAGDLKHRPGLRLLVAHLERHGR
jgi:TnpA family transposase